jgi:hypothetical protein
LLKNKIVLVENNSIVEIAPAMFWLAKDTGDGQPKIGTIVPPMIKEEANGFFSRKSTFSGRDARNST